MTGQSDGAGSLWVLLNRTCAWLAMISAVVLAFMMVLICVGVAMRYVLNDPIRGSNEILELASVAFVMLGLPYCTVTNAHIKIDMLDTVIGPFGVALTEILYRVLGIVILGFLVKGALKRASEAYEFEETTNMVSIPLWPFHWVIVVGMGLFALILLVQALALTANLGRQND